MNNLKDFFKNDNLKICSICGLEKELTFEHFPPKAANNNKPVNIKGLENLTPLGGVFYEKYHKSPKGMGGYKSCQTCNNLTGTWYANAYIDVNNQFLSVISESIDKENIELKVKVKPLNFFKQVMYLFLCADQATGVIRESVNETNFILDKVSKNLTDEISVWMGITANSDFLFNGIMVGSDGIHEPRTFARIRCKPFIFELFYDNVPIDKSLINITDFKNYNYDEEVEINYTLNFKKPQ